ncbi:MAG: gfo/Idh/MocA family oxidoreductase [Chitinivibrionales bacterium]|nr:gfo/Idh/MocA family oxidoreductase [Chitinivibrionales bacterium]MBD3356282.1 gfo/Idh/MocA family oxidoreductase [Chitinivibrionales bacterium]
MIRVAVIGYGYWGPNIVRNFRLTPGVRVTTICDSDTSVHQRIRRDYPDIEVVNEWKDVMRSPSIDAVAVVTPVTTHYDIAREALSNGKHVFVEKPFTRTVSQAAKLIDLAAANRLQIMVDHTFLFTGAVRKIKQLVEQKVLGDIYYYDSTRVNLGMFQHDVNVVWDLAPHDFSIMLYLLGETPESVTASGSSHVNSHEDVAYITVNFPHKTLLAHFNVNWLSPVKVRTTLIGGKRKMLVWDDLSQDEKIKIYDKGVNVKSREGIYDLLVAYRSGDMHAPKVDRREALTLECEHFVECIASGKSPLNDGEAGYEVVRMLQACDKSLRENGKPVRL